MKVIEVFKCNTIMIYFLLSFTLMQFSYEKISKDMQCS